MHLLIGVILVAAPFVFAAVLYASIVISAEVAGWWVRRKYIETIEFLSVDSIPRESSYLPPRRQVRFIVRRTPRTK